MTEIYLDVKSTAPAQEHIQRRIGEGALESPAIPDGTTCWPSTWRACRCAVGRHSVRKR
jgi:hypothetical protein